MLQIEYDGEPTIRRLNVSMILILDSFISQETRTIYLPPHIRGIVQQGKKLFLWKLDKVDRFGTAMSIANRRGRHLMVHSMDIKPTNQCHIPSHRLESTADFFVDRLTSREKAMLEATLKRLDGKCIRLGSTCSGTDIIKPVMECTFRALNKRFNVPL